jgi:hypothetical protein
MEVDMVETIAVQRHVNAGRQVGQIAVPPVARALSTLPRIDYEDGFVVDGDPIPGGSCEQWARAVLDDTPLAVRLKLLGGWWALGLRVGSPWSPRRVLGWEVRREEFGYVLLGAGSGLGLSGELLFKREPEGMLFATFARLHNPAARAVWGRTEAKHRAVVRSLLGHADRRCDRMLA